MTETPGMVQDRLRARVARLEGEVVGYKNDLQNVREMLQQAQGEGAALAAALRKSQDALIWMSGSPDFSSGGRGHKGYIRITRPAIERNCAALSDLEVT